MARLNLPAWVRRSHPVVRYEAGHWARSRAWRAARNLVWGGSLSFILVPAACAILFSLQSQFSSPSEAILTLGGVFAIGLALLTTLAVWFSNLSASILGATLIARERESQTWPFLRLTSLTGLDIAGGKFMALFYTLLGPLRLITGLRLLALLAGALTLVLTFAASGLTAQSVVSVFSPFFKQFGLTARPMAALGLVRRFRSADLDDQLAVRALLWPALLWRHRPGRLHPGPLARRRHCADGGRALLPGAGALRAGRPA